MQLNSRLCRQRSPLVGSWRLKHLIFAVPFHPIFGLTTEPISSKENFSKTTANRNIKFKLTPCLKSTSFATSCGAWISLIGRFQDCFLRHHIKHTLNWEKSKKMFGQTGFWFTSVSFGPLRCNWRRGTKSNPFFFSDHRVYVHRGIFRTSSSTEKI